MKGPNGEQRSGNPIARAVQIGQIATGEVEETMGMFEVTIAVGHKDGGDMHEVEVLVDTGALHTVLPDAFLRELHIEPSAERRVGFADSGSAVWSLGEARIAYGEESWTCPVFFSPATKCLLVSTTLEAFSLKVDPMERTLILDSLEARPF